MVLKKILWTLGLGRLFLLLQQVEDMSQDGGTEFT